MTNNEFKQQKWSMEMLPKDILINKIKKLKQTLAEIKEIASHCMDQELCTFCDYSDKCDRSTEDEALSYDVCKLILEKISEVIDD